MGLSDILKRKKDKEDNKDNLSRHNKKAHGKTDDFLPSSNPFQV
jgi:hypothetical protein